MTEVNLGYFWTPVLTLAKVTRKQGLIAVQGAGSSVFLCTYVCAYANIF